MAAASCLAFSLFFKESIVTYASMSVLDMVLALLARGDDMVKKSAGRVLTEWWQ
jgi:hypothetical protein